MGQWKLGYPSGLSSVSTELEGQALYEPWLAEALTLSSTTPSWRASKVLNTSGDTITISSGMTLDQFNGGYCKIRSGDQKGIVYKVNDTITNALILRNLDGSIPTLSLTNEYIEVVTGPATFTFPVGRNPLKRDVKISTAGEFENFPYYSGGLAIPINYVNDFVVNGYLTSQTDVDSLLMLTKLKIDYLGLDAMATNSPAAPLVLETGTHDAAHQFLVHCTEVKEIKEGMKGNVREIMMYFQSFEIPSYRGF